MPKYNKPGKSPRRAQPKQNTQPKAKPAPAEGKPQHREDQRQLRLLLTPGERAVAADRGRR
jgi:hypothetical protein